MYQSLHGKLRAVGQSTIPRPDWGHAIRDAAWCNTLRKVYQVGGLLSLPVKSAEGPRYTGSPQWPINVATDAIAYAYASGVAVAPDGLELGERLGRYRHESTASIDEWREAR